MSMWSHPTVYFQHKRRVSSFSGLQFFPSFDDEWFFAWPGKILWCALETNSLWEGHSQLAKVSVGWLLGFPCHFSVRTASPPGRSSRSFSLSHTVAASPVRLTFRREKKKKISGWINKRATSLINIKGHSRSPGDRVILKMEIIWEGWRRLKHQYLAALSASLLYPFQNGEVLDGTLHVCCEYACVYLCGGKVINWNVFALFSHTLFWKWWCWVSVAVSRLSLVATSGGCTLVVMHGLLIAVASLGVVSRARGLQQLWPMGLVPTHHVGGTKDRTHVSCISRWIPNHWTTKQVLTNAFILDFFCPFSPCEQFFLKKRKKGNLFPWTSFHI